MNVLKNFGNLDLEYSGDERFATMEIVIEIRDSSLTKVHFRTREELQHLARVLNDLFC